MSENGAGLMISQLAFHGLAKFMPWSPAPAARPLD